MKNLLKKIVAIFIFYFYCTLSFSHELWLEPVQFNLQPNDKLQAHIKVGQNFNGEKYPYIGAETVKLNLFQNQKAIKLKHRDGDYPAIQAVLSKKGSYVLSYQSVPELLEYDNYEKFKSFLEEQGLWDKNKFHNVEKITETYTRFAKSIIIAGNEKGSDHKTGLLFEMVLKEPIRNAKVNSYLPVKLLYHNKPYANSQITVFRSFEKTLNIDKIKTNSAGEANIPIKKGGLFLLNAVHFSENNNKKIPAKWQSLWSSLTFEIKFN